MIIKVLGKGCAKCNLLEKNTIDAVAELGIDATIEHVTDINKIMEYPILQTPGLVIDENLVVSGKVATREEVKEYLVKAQGQ